MNPEPVSEEVESSNTAATVGWLLFIIVAASFIAGLVIGKLLYGQL